MGDAAGWETGRPFLLKGVKMFGLGGDKKRRGVIGDDELVQAVRQRLLRELAEKQEAHQISNVINNHGGGSHGGGLMEAMHGGGGEDPMEYLVDIEKHDIPGPEGGKPVGWKKSVHRHRSPRGLAGE